MGPDKVLESEVITEIKKAKKLIEGALFCHKNVLKAGINHKIPAHF